MRPAAKDSADAETAAAIRLLNYCRANDWAGHDPYDALNSRLLSALPFLNFRIPRIALTQILKRSPVNLRGLLLVPKTQNPKALGLFLQALLKLQRLGLLEDAAALTESMVSRLEALRSGGTPYWCWGYSFPWQTRTLIVPRAAPSLVCTTFVGNALLDMHEHNGREKCREMAISAADYVLDQLYWSDGDARAGFAYPTPENRTEVHNANFLGSAFLGRVAQASGQQKYVGPALKAARYSLGHQQPDGSWFYGELPTQRWIDNFHTGYNLCALRSLGRSLGTGEFESAIKRGFDFYVDRFFRQDGAVRYFHDRDYPVDGHCVAQSIITLMELKDLRPGSVDLARRILGWAMARMWDDRGFFYYRVYPGWRIKTSYMRWVQAWMLLASSGLLCHLDGSASRKAASVIKTAAGS